MIKNKLFAFSILIIFFLTIIYYLKDDVINIPEFQDYNNRTLKILIPLQKCRFLSPKTLFFLSKCRNNTTFKSKKYKIINRKITKNFFVTYYTSWRGYYMFEEILSENGLMRSYNTFGEHNLFFGWKIIKLIEKDRKNFQINKYKKYNYFFGYEELEKDKLYNGYIEMKKQFDSDFNFMPETFIYPNDKSEIIKRFEKYKLEYNNLWLIKPSNEFGGHGISILSSLKEIKYKRYLITKYLTNLHLINNKKYDLRLYILVTGLKPLRIYFSQQGLVRIASHNFSLNENSIKDKYIHLTNSGLNSKSKDYIFPNIQNNTHTANMWNLNEYSKHLQGIGVNFSFIREKTKDIIIKSIISVYRKLIEKLDHNNLIDNNYYNLLGYDIIITNKFEPMLLEINTMPNLLNYTNLDYPIYTNVFIDTLNLIGITPFYRRGKYDIKNNDLSNIQVKEAVNNAICELNRPRGDFELIFPLQSNIKVYKKFFNIQIEENEMFWKKIDDGI